MPRAKKQIIVTGVHQRGGMLRVSVGADDTRRHITVGEWTTAAAIEWSRKRLIINQEIEHGTFRWQDYFTPKQWGEKHGGVTSVGGTFADWCKALLSNKGDGKAQSAEVTRSRLKKWAHLSDRRVASLKPNDLAIAYRKAKCSSLAPNSQRAIISAARQVLTLAKENAEFKGELEAFYALDEKLTAMTPARGKSPKGALKPEQMELVLSTIRANYLPVYADWFEFVFFSGLRPSEARALRFSDLDFEAGVIHVRRAKYAHFEEATPKTAAGVRDVRMLPRARAALARRLEVHGSLDGLVFRHPATDGYMDYHRDSSGVTTVWYEALEMAGLPRVRPYVARHTFASAMFNAGVELRLIAHQLGHANTDVTQEVYAEFQQREGDWAQIDRVAEKLSPVPINVPFSA